MPGLLSSVQPSWKPRAAVLGRALGAAALQMLALLVGTAATLVALYGTLWLSG